MKALNGLVACLLLVLGLPITWSCACHNYGVAYATTYMVVFAFFMLTGILKDL